MRISYVKYFEISCSVVLTLIAWKNTVCFSYLNMFEIRTNKIKYYLRTSEIGEK
ncbi:MAG TPA: hypothetical protein PLK41_08805 [Defluviitoga tunisiensis]|nr:hypothetical protein [Defluviitoga tunisiensis]HOL87414.1 hypothetical protein [Defluviitoga tunisiensis]HPP11073.1 hypothetical protein [Defluviitoga tunisiensis]